jgi:hypothetical protein
LPPGGTAGRYNFAKYDVCTRRANPEECRKLMAKDLSVGLIEWILCAVTFLGQCRSAGRLQQPSSSKGAWWVQVTNNAFG